MIVDADCHISSSRFDAQAIVIDDLLNMMDKAAVDKSLVWLKPPYDKNIEPENRAVYEAAKRHPDRVVGFGWCNPRLGKERALRAIRQTFEEYDLAGIKFNGAQDDYVIDDEQVLAYIEMAVSYGRPIAFHIGADFYENTHPYRLGRIARRYPQGRFLLIHLGGAALPPLARAAIETVAANPNIMIIGSAVPDVWILRAITALGAGRVCFGSDVPFALMHAQLAMYRAILRDASQEETRQVLGENIMRWVARL